MRNLFLGGAALLAAAAASPAQASVIVSLTSVTSVSGGTDWTYSVTLSQDEQLDTAVQAVFFTLYDFGLGSLVNATGDLGGGNWSFTDATGLKPAEGTKPTNNPSIPDIRFTYNGPVLNGPSLGTGSGNLGTFTLFTTAGGTVNNNIVNNQDAQLEKYAPGSPDNDHKTSNLASVGVPLTPAVMEPASLVLLVSGMVGLGLTRRPRRVSSVVS